MGVKRSHLEEYNQPKVCILCIKFMQQTWLHSNIVFQVVTDLIYVACYNISLSSSILILRISAGHLPSVLVSLYGFYWQVSLVTCIGILDCLSLIRLSIAHGWGWVYEWQARSVHHLCAFLTFLQLAGAVGTDLYRVSCGCKWSLS